MASHPPSSSQLNVGCARSVKGAKDKDTDVEGRVECGEVVLTEKDKADLQMLITELNITEQVQKIRYSQTRGVPKK